MYFIHLDKLTPKPWPNSSNGDGHSQEKHNKTVSIFIGMYCTISQANVYKNNTLVSLSEPHVMALED